MQSSGGKTYFFDMDTLEENGSVNVSSEQISASSSTSQPINVLISQTNPIQQAPVIQSNQPSVCSVIQQPVKSALLLNTTKPNSVIHQAIQIKPEPNIGHGMIDSDEDSGDGSEDDSPKRRRDLTRRPSYRKILNDLGGGEIGGILNQPGNSNENSALHASSGTIVQYSQDGNLYVPVNLVGNNVIAEDQSRKREMRLLKNREAARECRRKKKEYIKCLENRVAVLENQNKALIEELKSLKELYCQQKDN